MKFWDASAVIPLCVRESPTPLVKRTAEQDEAIVVWWTTPLECYSAFARRRRDEILTRAQEDQARQAVLRLAANWTEVQPSHQVREAAGRALLLHPLRAADALQLAAALVWAGGRVTHHEFVCLDQRLREAAQREGFEVLP
ncbi:MAG: type II toxin-antitoxin system VapC family toxin [candidate division NC10 bacterium]|nr:type II toxin-antitoxin system VapC family toxin [candidate division NC10 bacterium]